MRFRKDRVFWMIVLALIAIGLVAQLRHFVIPIIVFGTIFLLYKYPPSRWGSFSGMKSRQGRAERMKRSKKAKFRVIDGSRRDDEDPPPYH